MTFKLGDYVQVHRIDNVEIRRLDMLFMHKWDRANRLFVTTSIVTMGDNDDAMLGSGYRLGKLTPSPLDQPLIVGLPAISSLQLYVVPVQPDVASKTPARLPRHIPRLKIGESNTMDVIWAPCSLLWL